MQLGTYTISREIGKSELCVVYRGHAPGGRDVAVKVLLGTPRTCAVQDATRKGTAMTIEEWLPGHSCDCR